MSELCEEHKSCHVIYDAQECPLCQAEEELGDLQTEIVDLQTEVADLKEEVDQLTSDLDVEFGVDPLVTEEIEKLKTKKETP